ncbi:hypothetical protein LIA77_10701 [Sarocladium implicatum]|nr:hypothetical protein LIA77_10701 [Sarocladium implicatum]
MEKRQPVGERRGRFLAVQPRLVTSSGFLTAFRCFNNYSGNVLSRPRRITACKVSWPSEVDGGFSDLSRPACLSYYPQQSSSANVDVPLTEARIPNQIVWWQWESTDTACEGLKKGSARTLRISVCGVRVSAAGLGSAWLWIFGWVLDVSLFGGRASRGKNKVWPLPLDRRWNSWRVRCRSQRRAGSTVPEATYSVVRLRSSRNDVIPFALRLSIASYLRMRHVGA